MIRLCQCKDQVKIKDREIAQIVLWFAIIGELTFNEFKEPKVLSKLTDQYLAIASMPT